jgi:branched-chain amino acid transport system ATP-binding protein
MEMAVDGDILEARHIRVLFGGLKAVDGVDLALRRGEILGLIGPNGAGKTTLVNAISGFQRPTEGAIFLDGHDVTRWKPRHRAKRGLTRTFQDIRLFAGLTVFENVEAGAVGVGMRRSAARRLAWDLLERVHLADHSHRPAASLPHGAERRLGIARALATRPRFLLLDEPAAGLNESESDELVTVLGAIRTDYSLGLLVIEHDMRMIMRLCERIQVLDSGATLATGPPAEIRSNEAVIDAYLGSASEAALARR